MVRHLAIFVFLFIYSCGLAVANDQFITVVNPVRISHYNPDSSEGVSAQYGIINEFGLPATWLMTYDALSDPKLVKVIKGFSNNQELGIFMEITPSFAKASGVTYFQSGSWHFGSSVFLTGYTREDRLKLIDRIFSKFKETFDSYPTSVGAWWIDSASIKYMKDKYEITAVLGCADQYATDNYQLWGQYWSTPFYPSLHHAGTPAQDVSNKIDVVKLQWAARHPRDGYLSSLYSTQDYFTLPKKESTEYFSRLLDIYQKSQNRFSQITVGLEGDFSPNVYQGEFKNQIAIVAKNSAKKTTMAGFADWYQMSFPEVSPEQTIEIDNFIWYQSPFYRVGLDKKTNTIVDMRVYSKNIIEPYDKWPQREKDLRIYIPSVIDTHQSPNEKWELGKAEIKFSPEYLTISNLTLAPPKWVTDSLYLEVKQSKSDTWKFIPKKEYPWSPEGATIRDWSLEAKHILKSPRTLLKTIFSKDIQKLSRETYSISSGELEALEKLRLMESGKVLVYDHECLQCSWFGLYRPAVFANTRRYVKDYSQKPIVYNKSIVEAQDRVASKKELQALKVKYIYLVKYADYQEILPFSPGDLGVEVIFENAYVKIWQVI